MKTFAFPLLLLLTSMSLRTGQLHANETLALVIDCSASMQNDRKALFAKEAVKLVLAMNRDEDDVEVIGFSDRLQTSLSQNNSLQQSMRFVDELRIDGGTDYLLPLKSPKCHQCSHIIFLSDGEPQNGAAEIHRYIQTTLQNHVTLHTVAVGCQADSPAEKLLRDMAVLTNGTFTSVAKAEELVETFCRLVVRLNGYRRHTPQEKELLLSNAIGRVLGVTYDAQPSIFQDGQPVQGDIHTAHLSRETVRLWMGNLPQRADLRLVYQQPESPQSRWGDIYRSDLLKTNISVDAPDGRIAARAKLIPKLSFTDKNGKQVDPRGNPNLSAKMSLVDELGRIIDSTDAKPADDGPHLIGTLKTPAEQTHVTLKVTSSQQEDEHQWQDEQSLALQAVSPVKVATNEKQLRGKVKLGPFDKQLTLTLPHPVKVSGVTGRQQDKESHCQLLAVTHTDNQVTLRFDALRTGHTSGSVELHLTGDQPIEVITIPYQFEVMPRGLGLNIAKQRTVDLGTQLACSGQQTFNVGFPGLDTEAIQYQVSVKDFSNNQFALPVQVHPQELSITKQNPGTVAMSVDLQNAPTGEFTGAVTLTSPMIPNQKWTTQLKLRVIEPLDVQVTFPDGAIGSSIAGEIRITNRSPHTISQLTISLDEFQGPKGSTADDLIVEFAPEIKSLAGNETRMLKLPILVSPLIEKPGTYTSMLHVSRSGRSAVEVPVKVRVLSAEQRPHEFQVAPEELAFTAKPNEVVEFSLRIRATKALQSPVALKQDLGLFQNQSKDPAKVVAELVWIDGDELNQQHPLALSGFVVAPSIPGTYHSQVKITGTTLSEIKIPLSLTVK